MTVEEGTPDRQIEQSYVVRRNNFWKVTLSSSTKEDYAVDFGKSRYFVLKHRELKSASDSDGARLMTALRIEVPACESLAVGIAWVQEKESN
jgi:hypothetical protein